MNKEKLIVVNEHFQLQFEQAQDCFVLLYPEGMVQLNQSAGEIMNQCDGTKNFNEIVSTLEEKFNMPNLSNDIEAFFDEAFDRKWVSYVN
ncbi:pyrroloquinoline quinone biosynthesis peptide chaperone PqqD [Arcobacter arenosus]|jgi:pyrroloquinoline quinone biosynthesis protein D|uniref:Pyrroloquinoline quinone biosynthesis peptide chaperone PqqD n=1 Tax=Arcobacter arenosus TaxID=2576037 RepID=A0A5R8Y0B3_9BACT|nr:pyrroloquinoline quinone biosynthesis peptide chaperone PqqD [Arcobacter arenosus]TLP38311.1 pyrroloquinoline quinone biosynthesis peptide chaperone PqqD [Arcobacter arenosus]